MISLEYSQEAVDTLVAPRPHLMEGYENGRRMLFCTISPNPKCLHKIQKGKQKYKMPYGRLPQRCQYEYCLKILRTCYLDFLPNAMVYGVPEMNKEHNIHIHFILYDRNNMWNDTQLNVFRRDVLNCEEVLRNLSNKTMTDYMNNIVWLLKSKDEIHKYFNKCNHDMINSGFKNFYYNLT